MTTKCPGCGSAAVAGKFCGSCGSKVPESVPPVEAQAQRAPESKTRRRVGWPLLALGILTAVLVAMATYSVIRPSEVSLSQVASRVSGIQCSSTERRVEIDKGKWTFSDTGSGSGQGTYAVDGDSITIKGQFDAGHSWDLTVSGLTSVYLSLDTPITVKYAGSQSFVRAGSGTASGPLGVCRRA